MNLYGLIGFPLSHSFSKNYFTERFKKENIKNSKYDLFPLEQIDDLPILLSVCQDLKGLNVTIPYKELVLPFLDEIEESAATIGAVNTIKIRQGKLKGYNTDVYGFEKSLLRFVRNTHDIKALVLGTGGAAKAVAYVLNQLKISFQYISRKEKANAHTYEWVNAEVLQEHRLIINTTPLGMSPNVESCPDIPYEHLSAEHYLFDLVYNPNVTQFLKQGKEQGCLIQNGLEMLHLQAEKAWNIWTNE